MLLAEFMTQTYCLSAEYLKILTDEIVRESVRSGSTQQQQHDQRQARSPGESRVVVLNISGPLSQRGGFFSSLFGGTSYEDISIALHEAAADAKVECVILNLDSPGGIADSVLELTDEIYNLRKYVPIVAQVNTLAASAAYWIASAASEIVVTPSGHAGSVGVYRVHMDLTKAFDKEGIKPTIIRAGENKIRDSGIEPLTDPVRQQMQDSVNHVYATMAVSIARNRNTTVDNVFATYGAGLLYNSGDLLKRKMVDRIGTLADTVARFGYAIRPAPVARASARQGAFASASAPSVAALREQLHRLQTLMIDIAGICKKGGVDPETTPQYRQIKSSLNQLETQLARLTGKSDDSFSASVAKLVAAADALKLRP